MPKAGASALSRFHGRCNGRQAGYGRTSSDRARLTGLSPSKPAPVRFTDAAQATHDSRVSLRYGHLCLDGRLSTWKAFL